MLSIGEFLLFLAIGWIVSLDVAGLTAVRNQTYTGNRSDLVWWAVQNGFWHSGLLLLYGIFTLGLIDIAVPVFLINLVEYLNFIHAPRSWIDAAIEVRGHFAVMFALATIGFVWAAYRKKIVDDPLQPGTDSVGWQARAIRWLLTQLRLTAGIVGNQMQSVAVAIDMLALAFLLKALQVFHGSPVRIVAIAACIFISVTATTLIVAALFRRAFNEMIVDANKAGEDCPPDCTSLTHIMLILRLLEPLLIFYFISELMSFVIWGRLSSSSLFFVSAALLVYALIKSVSFKRIVAISENAAISLVNGGIGGPTS